MTKSDKTKYKVLTEEDMKIIQSDPVGLSDYIVRTKVKETKKTAFIITIVAMFVSFGIGVMVGTTWTKTSIPNNVVQIQVGDAVSEKVIDKVEETEEGK